MRRVDGKQSRGNARHESFFGHNQRQAEDQQGAGHMHQNAEPMPCRSMRSKHLVGSFKPDVQNRAVKIRSEKRGAIGGKEAGKTRQVGDGAVLDGEHIVKDKLGRNAEGVDGKRQQSQAKHPWQARAAIGCRVQSAVRG